MDSVSQVFLAEAFDSWALALAKKENTSWDEVCSLVSYGAVFQGEDPVPLSTAFEQMAVLAVVKFLKLSSGMFQERLVPLLCKYLLQIGKFTWLSSGVETTRFSSVDNFAYALCKRLIECPGMKRETYDEISTSILAYLDSVQECLENSDSSILSRIVHYHSLHGFLRALLDASVEISDMSLIFLVPALSGLLNKDWAAITSIQRLTEPEKANYSYVNLIPILDEFSMKSLLSRSIVRVIVQSNSILYEQYYTAWNSDKILLEIQPIDEDSQEIIRPVYENIWKAARSYLIKPGSDPKISKEYLFLTSATSLALNKIPLDFVETIREAFQTSKGLLSWELQISLFSSLQSFIPKSSSIAQQALIFLDDIENRHLWCHRDLLESEREPLKNCYGLTYVCALKNVDVKFDFSTALMRHVNNVCALAPSMDRQLTVQISIIEKLVELSHNDTMTEDLVPLLVGRLNEIHQKPGVSKLLLSTLIHVSLATSCQNFVEVMDAIISTFKQSLKVDNNDKGVKTEIAKQIIRLSESRNFENKNRERLLQRIMVVFVEQASNTHSHTHGGGEYVMLNDSSNLVLVLDVIAKIITDFSQHSNFSEKQELISLLRKIWAYAIVFGVDSTGVWKRDWKSLMETISCLTPCLASGKSAKLSLSEVKSDLSCFSRNEEMPVTKSLLNISEVAFAPSGSIKMFLKIIFHIDSLLLDQNIVPKVYTYLNDLYELDIRDDLRKITNQILNRTLESRDADLVTELVRSLIFLFPSFNLKLYNFVFSHIDFILRKHPYVVRDPTIVQCVFEMLQILSKAADDDYLGRTIYTYKLNIENNEYNIDIPTGYEYRQHIFGEYRKFWRQCYEGAAKTSSNEIISLMQNYIMTMRKFDDKVTGHAGFTLAIEICISKHGCCDFSGILVNALSFHSSQLSNTARFFDLFSQRTFDTGSTKSLNRHFDSIAFNSKNTNSGQLEVSIKQDLKQLSSAASRNVSVDNKKLYETFSRAASILIHSSKVDSELLYLLCFTPVQYFTESSLMAGVDAWTWLVTSRPDLKIQFMSVQVEVWEWTIRRNRGIFSQKFNVSNAFSKKMNYGPSKQPKELESSFTYFMPHLIWIQFLMSHYDSNRGISQDFTLQYLRMVEVTIFKRGKNSNHPLSRMSYLKLWHLFRKVIIDSHISDWNRETYLLTKIYELLLGILAMPTSWNAYDDKYVAGDIEIMLEIFRDVKEDLRQELWDFEEYYNDDISSKNLSNEQEIFNSKHSRVKTIQKISVTVIELELHRLFVWYNPLKDPKLDVFDDTEFRVRKKLSKKFCRVFIKEAWNISPTLAVHLAQKGSLRGSREVLYELAAEHAFYCTPYCDAISYIAQENNIKSEISALKYSIFWAPVSPITSISYFLPNFYSDPYLIQYGLRSLDNYSTELVFFYVPQIVQTLRSDALGYAEAFIVSTAKISQLFAHQIIWNMNANMFKDEESADPDNLKPTLDRIVEKIISSLDGTDKEFYEREFSFFEKVTGISGKLKPYIKKTKAEKKEKIDKELRKIMVDPGVYLPSNPESIVVDIDYNSGKPLQSHAKAPFMATFKIKRSSMQPIEVKDKRQSSYESLYLRDDQNDEIASEVPADEDSLWQSAIFKVGDDCRQDLLALQLIAIFSNIFAHVGLDLYLFPYRIVATAPGCGVIEVVPNSVSRDQMGRSNINNLHEWFLATYGPESTLSYQMARDNFVKSLAAYSIILYLLQIKDRHNGNMLIDKEGRIIHIGKNLFRRSIQEIIQDFGFIFDITPGGVKFELSPFKLTKEMIQILDGNPDSLTYRKFVTYCVKAFLAARPYAENVIQMVKLMLESGLPCFKGERTINRLRDRFQLELSEKLAAEYMMKLVQSSHQAWSTTIYDGYQKLTNGIPF